MNRDAGSDRSDDEIARRALRNPADFAPLYERHARAIYGYCYNRSRDSAVANDLTAQVFVRAIERLQQYRTVSGGSFRSWLFAIARSIVADYWRQTRPFLSIDTWGSEEVDGDPGPEEIVLHQMEMERLLDALDRLPERYREIIELRLAGLASPEIADSLGISRSAVKSAQTRAYRLLRNLLTVGQEGSVHELR